MFTGIITATGQIQASERLGKDRRLSITLPPLFNKGVRLGDSVAVSGVCLTVVKISKHALAFVVSPETLRKTTLGELEVGDAVNLEKAMGLGATLDGHLVSGHVDGVGVLRSLSSVSNSWRCEFSVPAALRRFMAVKGSVCVDGVSLTINRVTKTGFEVMLIPHTQQVTTLKHLVKNQRVNIEIDLLARYLDRLLTARGWRLSKR